MLTVEQALEAAKKSDFLIERGIRWGNIQREGSYNTAEIIQEVLIKTGANNMTLGAYPNPPGMLVYKPATHPINIRQGMDDRKHLVMEMVVETYRILINNGMIPAK